MISNEPTVAQWLRKIQLDWQLGESQLAELAHTDVEALRQALAFQSASPSIPEGTVPPGLHNAVPLISIYRKLSALISNPEDQVKWLSESHAAFDQNSPLAVMRSSVQNLFWVAYYLDSAPARN